LKNFLDKLFNVTVQNEKNKLLHGRPDDAHIMS
jgi:hypothetical protein